MGDEAVRNPTGGRETLEQLRGDETTLEREIAAARAEAAGAVERARREAESIAAEARREAEREAERLRGETDEELDRAHAAARAALLADAEELRRRATRNLERAVGRAIDVVIGRRP